ncbi:MAG: hypothetical protein R3C16_12875 [Hyphomonadaceae bacterium]
MRSSPRPMRSGTLESNINANNLAGAITARRAAVSAAPGRANFFVARDVSFSSLHQTARGRQRGGRG